MAVYLEELSMREAEINKSLKNTGSSSEIVEETIGDED